MNESPSISVVVPLFNEQDNVEATVRAIEAAFGPRCARYEIVLVESPPLPPPARVSPFGGLGDFGLGDLGFDPGGLGGVLSDIADQAGTVMDAVDAAVDAAQALSSLAGLADLASISNPLTPLVSKVGDLGKLAEPAADLTQALGDIQP